MTERYRTLVAQTQALLDRDYPLVTNLSNAAALLRQAMDRINWAGVYLLDGGVLWLGPFQGKPACARIETGKGVCGTAVSRGQTQLVQDVRLFPGHIACDCASRSEIVIPIHKDGAIFGVLDIDSAETGRFTEADRGRIGSRRCGNGRDIGIDKP